MSENTKGANRNHRTVDGRSSVSASNGWFIFYLWVFTVFCRLHILTILYACPAFALLLRYLLPFQSKLCKSRYCVLKLQRNVLKIYNKPVTVTLIFPVCRVKNVTEWSGKIFPLTNFSLCIRAKKANNRDVRQFRVQWPIIFLWEILVFDDFDQITLINKSGY